MGWYLDGRVTAVVGTHTHVTTADEHVLPGGTAYITDVGMSGPHGGVIGMDRDGIIKKFLDGLPARFEVASGDIQMNCVLIETDDEGPRNASGRFARAPSSACASASTNFDWGGSARPLIIATPRSRKRAGELPHSE